MLAIKSFVDNTFAENAYVVTVEGEGSPEVGVPCWVIDPGLPPAIGEMVAYLTENELRPAAIVLTHGHADHIAGVDAVKKRFPEALVYLSEPEHTFFSDPMLNLSGMAGAGFAVKASIDHDLAPGTTLTLGPTAWQVFDTSGHSPGGRSLYCAAEGVVFSGDALFAGSIGRTDFPGSNGERLIRNIRENLLTLPDETAVYSGHGPTTTIGQEQRTNPFLMG